MQNSPLYPLTLEPFLRPMPWGGRRLASWVKTPFPAEPPIGEAWLLSDHALHASRINNGPLAGCSVRELIERRAVDLLGRLTQRFPLLIKLLDARENLSIQVHPDDEMAERLAANEGGKTEAWHVLETAADASVYLGLKPGCDRGAFLRGLGDGTAPALLNRHHPQPGETYFVPAGTIHALGGGVVVLEVQQTSDATFRLYDWGRVDFAGRPRQLHLEAGLASLRETIPTAGPREPQPLPGRRDGQRLVACDYFQIDRFRLQDQLQLASPCLWFGLGGKAVMTSQRGEVEVGRGELILIPACVTDAVVAAEGACDGILIGMGNNET
jgi:mannose-6-phosphate isomerase